MEAPTLKKILSYSILAVILGLALVLLPLITVAEIRPQNSYLLPESLSGRFKQVEGVYYDVPQSSSSDVQVFAVSFLMALVAYLLVRRKRPYRDSGLIMSIPY